MWIFSEKQKKYIYIQNVICCDCRFKDKYQHGISATTASVSFKAVREQQFSQATIP